MPDQVCSPGEVVVHIPAPRDDRLVLPPSPLLVRPGLGVLPLRAVLTELDATTRPEHAVLVNTGAPYRLVETLEGVAQQTPGAPGDVAVVPAGAGLGVRSLDGSPQRVESLVVLLSTGLLEEVLDAAGLAAARHELVPVVGARSPQVAQLAALVRSALPDSTALPDADGLGRLALESLGHALAVAVVREHSTARASREVPAQRTALSRDQVRRVLRYVEDRLDAPLTLAELAAVAHVSPYHFARQFRLATGSSPHEYVVQRRVARAEELLRGTRVPLSEIARRCGFADQSHLTRQVRRRLGATPAALRAAAVAT